MPGYWRPGEKLIGLVVTLSQRDTFSHPRVAFLLQLPPTLFLGAFSLRRSRALSGYILTFHERTAVWYSQQILPILGTFIPNLGIKIEAPLTHNAGLADALSCARNSHVRTKITNFGQISLPKSEKHLQLSDNHVYSQIHYRRAYSS